MTLPHEEHAALNSTREFMRELLIGERWKRLPREVRVMARQCLRHYPGEWRTREFYLDGIRDSKVCMRRKLASLPIEEKFEILEALNARSKTIRKATKRGGK